MPQAVTSSHKWSIQPTGSKEIDSSPLRCGLTSLLPKIRFLLPLCSQRWRLVHELLHTTELSAPDYMPVIMVDRRVPLVERHADSRSSVFLQVHRELRGEKLHFRWNKWKYDQWWEVKFVGEGIIDQGGGFRDSLAELADELCPLDEHIPEILPYFIKTPNHRVWNTFSGYTYMCSTDFDLVKGLGFFTSQLLFGNFFDVCHFKLYL